MPSLPTVRALIRNCCLAFCVTAASTASGHGAGPPRATQILTQPDDRQHLVVASPSWGVFQSHDGGNRWQYICAEVTGGASLNRRSYSAALISGGRLALGSSQLSGIFITDDGCAWENRMVRGDAPVSSLTVDSTGALLALIMLSSDGGAFQSSVLRSTDGGSTFDSFGPELPDFVGAI